MYNKNGFKPGFMLLRGVVDDYDATAQTHEHNHGDGEHEGTTSSNPPTEPINATFSINDN